ncbi:unnamed protein product [Heligmosomoides polygyrus]|uniref:Reverse transcriptase domain-containing protein n=1 Tax=Heligmosomoides polygyrus TaxID=6339 RepID=A0A183G7F1_HELPZ|nr:unnamed protein product [Heligmosomoides polygyrus]
MLPVGVQGSISVKTNKTVLLRKKGDVHDTERWTKDSHANKQDLGDDSARWTTYTPLRETLLEVSLEYKPSLCLTFIGLKKAFDPVETTAIMKDHTGVDNCCIEHDTLIDDYHVAREEADRIFCQCLSDKSGWYARNVVKPLFCTAVMLYTKLFEREAVKAVNGTAYEHVETP